MTKIPVRRERAQLLILPARQLNAALRKSAEHARGNLGQIKFYKQALSLRLIATSLIAVRAYQSSATAIFDYSSYPTSR